MELFDLARYGVLPKNKKILLFEAFSGIGTQAMAFERLKELIGIDYEVVGFSEIDKYAIMSYHAIHGEHLKNYGDISKIEQLPKCDVCTWSFPCQDISLAGHQKGMVEGTRSNYGFDFIETVRRSEHKPKILIMENVKALVSERFQDDFKEIQERLKSMGYENHWKVLNAKHYEVAQNRERVFMISILGGGYFQFPPKVKLTKRLKDYLEDEVDEKYYLTEKMIKTFMNDGTGKYPRKERFLQNILRENQDIGNAITTNTGNRPTDNFIIKTDNDENLVYKTKKDDMPRHRIYDSKGVGFAITTNKSQQPSIMIPEATKKGYALAEDGDGVYINRPHQKRGVVQKQMIQTIKTSGDDIGVVTNNLRIRKLTPRECWRLMDISDDDYDKASKVCSNSQLYKQAGNAIVVNVLVQIFKNLIE